MILAAALLAGSDPPGAWVPVGVSGSHLRVFVERASLRVTGERRSARVRIGSPKTITGSIVVVFQDEEIDCHTHSWRLVAYEARDAAGHTVSGGRPTGAALVVVPGTIGDQVVSTICAM